MQVLCQYCKNGTKKVDQQLAVKVDGKNFHPVCAQLYIDKKELSETIARVLKLKAPGPKNNMLIKMYLEKGYTARGMIQALTYHYDVKKASLDKAGERIGIIPYVYDEAQEYYEKIAFQNKKRLEQAEKLKEENREVNYVRVEKIDEIKTVIKEVPMQDFFNEE